MVIIKRSGSRGIKNNKFELVEYDFDGCVSSLDWMDTESLIPSRGYKKVCMYKWQIEFLFQNSKSTKLKKKNLNKKLKVQVCKSAKSQI